jgi:DNA adenine methylase
VDHKNSFATESKFASGFLMTYDNATDLRDLAKKHNFDSQLVTIKGTHHAEIKELLIGPNLDCVRG